MTARPRWWRCDPRVATFVHQRVDAVIGPVATVAIGNRLDDVLGIYDRAGEARRRRFRSRSSTASPGR